MSQDIQDLSIDDDLTINPAMPYPHNTNDIAIAVIIAQILPHFFKLSRPIPEKINAPGVPMNIIRINISINNFNPLP